MATKMHVSGDELKKLLKLAKKRPMPFAFCPSAGDDDNVLIIHRKRKPDMLGKVAKKEGEGTKVAFGTFTIKGREMSMTCEREIAGLAKKMKRHMKIEKKPMNIIILDMSGNVLESDIEDLPPEEEEDIDAEVDEEVEEDEDEAAAFDAIAEEEDESLDVSELSARIKAIKPEVDKLPGELNTKLTKILGLAVQGMKSGNVEASDKAIAAVEAALERLAGATAPDAPPPPAEGAIAMVQRINKAKGQAETAGGELKDKVLGFLAQAATAVKSGDVAKAGQVMDAVEQALAKAKPAAAAANETPEAPADGPDLASPDGQKWTAASQKLMPVVESVLSSGKGDISAISASWAMATERAENGDFAGAIAIVPRLSDLLRAAQNATQTQAEADIPADVVPFVKSRLSWIDTRKKLNDEISKLKSAIDKELSGIEGMEDAAAQTGKLFDHLSGLDDRLEATLEKLVETPDGSARETLKTQARGIIGDYQNELNSSFFQDVDTNNGFVNVAVRSTALDALKTVSAALT